MRVKTLEIRWHDGKPIYSCDFLRRPSRIGATSASGSASGSGSGQLAYKFATGGADTHIRIWLIHPTNPAGEQKGPKAEYLSTLSKHAGAVNVVRWSPNGEFLASAGDDGMVVIWTRDERNSATLSWGRDPADVALDKEHWRAVTSFKCTSQEVYDLAWSPTGEYIITGSTDNTARIFTAADGRCIKEITDHSHYVQGVAWDPMNEYIATQSSDRSVRVYSVSTKHGVLETHPLRQNTHVTVRHSRTPSTHSHSRAPSVGRPSSASRPTRHVRRSSISSDTDSITEHHNHTSSSAPPPLFTTNLNMSSSASGGGSQLETPLTPAMSVASSSFLPPATKEPTANMSRRSSFSERSNAPGSPQLSQSHRSTYGRSPSPMPPPLPAIRVPAATAAWAAMRLYGDENVTNFFRRLAFSPDGGMLLTPAGHYEDSAVMPGRPTSSTTTTDDPPVKQRKRDKENGAGSGEGGEDSASSCVYIYSRANFSRPPIASLPGHRKATICVKFSPVLYELRPGVIGGERGPDAPVVDLEPGREDMVELGTTLAGGTVGRGRQSMRESLPSPAPSHSQVPTPSTPSFSQASTPSHQTQVTPSSSHSQATGSVFSIPYRMLFAVATQDTVMIHDTQQAGPICMFAKLHYDSFTDLAWSHDGQVLMLVSSDGYCTIVLLEEDIPQYHLQQHNLQLQSIALSHSHSLIAPGHATAVSSPAVRSDVFLPRSPAFSTGANPLKRGAGVLDTPLLTPTTSVDGGEPGSGLGLGLGLGLGGMEKEGEAGPAKKKRRVELKHHGQD